MRLQQQGFYNMTHEVLRGLPRRTYGWRHTSCRQVQDRCDLLAVAQGQRRRPPDHVPQDERAGGSITKALVCWGQNPAVTEPHQGASATASTISTCWSSPTCSRPRPRACDRKATGITYLIPAAAHVENGWQRHQLRSYAAVALSGSQALPATARPTSSSCSASPTLSISRQMRSATSRPCGHGCWHSVTATSVYDELYGSQYADGWDPTSATAFEALSGTAEVVAPTGNAAVVPRTVTGCEWVSEKIFQRDGHCRARARWRHDLDLHRRVQLSRAAEHHERRARPGSVGRHEPRQEPRPHQLQRRYAYHGWGYAWLVNRRVLYNNNNTETGWIRCSPTSRWVPISAAVCS